MAVVLLARDGELARPVAVKLLADNLARDAGFRQRFLREARLAARLSHPNVVKVYDAGEDGARPYIVMEYVEGETIAEVLARRGRLPPEEAIGLAVQACAGLEHAHTAGLVHRDVKPQNLLLREDGTLKLVDFGIARAVEATRLTQAGTILGTGAYLSPEQAAGEDVTTSADVYSLGVVLYELLTGRTPYSYESLAQLAHEHAGQPIEPVRDLAPRVPERLEGIVMRCLARNPAYRPPSAAALAAELRAAYAPGTATAATEPLGAAPPAEVVGQSHNVGWRGARWIAAAAAVLSGAVALALLLRDGGDAEPAAPPRIEAVPRGDTAAEQARNLAAWLRGNSGR